MSTKIEWTQETWNPIVGCSKVSPGCENCYAERMAKRLKAMKQTQYQDVVDEDGWTGEIVMAPGKTLQIPWHWKNPRMIFVCSMSDLFHKNVKFEWIDTIFITIKSSPQHTFQILTKRAERMAEYFSTREVPENVWVGVTAEDQQRADERVPQLLKIDAKVRFVSVEPMLGPVDLYQWMGGDRDIQIPHNYKGGINWAIVGGESGPGARPMDPDWARGLRNQCINAGVPFFFKQWGEWITGWQWLIGDRALSDIPDKAYVNAKPLWTDQVYRVGKNAAGRLLDGGEWNEMPKEIDDER